MRGRLLLGLRLALPYALKSYVNSQLDKARGYRGVIGDVEVHVWRGAYRIHSVGIWSSISTLLRHAFIRALVPKLDAPSKWMK